MRKMVMVMLTGGTVLLSSMTAIAGMLTGISTVGSGLNAKVEVVADAPLTYVFFRKDATHWVIDLAKTEMGSVAPVTELGFPAATGLTAEKRQAGSVPITRLTIAVRPGVSLTVKPSGDRKQLTLSFQSGSAPAVASKELDLLDDLDAPAKPAAAAKAPAVKDDLDALLDAPVPVAAAAPATVPVTAPQVKGKVDELALEAELDKEPAAKPVKAVATEAPSLDKELDAVAEPAAAPVKPVLAALVPEQRKIEEPKVGRDPLPATPAVSEAPIVPVAPAAPAIPPGVDLGALTPDELGIASPEPVTTAPAVKPAKAILPEPAKPAAVPVAEPAASAVKNAPASVVAASTGGGAGSIVVVDRSAEVVVDNFTSHKAFTLMDPTRLVIDFPGAKAALKEAAAKVKIAGIQAVRFSQYPDKVRLVFDLPKGDLPEYTIEKLASGIRVTFK